jgi:beta-N-acetylhexosaminidase
VLDLAYEASRSVLSSRAVSADPRQATAYAREFLAGLRAKNVIGCGKHFPGLGEGHLDSHKDLPVIRKNLKKMWKEDLLPYRMLRAHLPMVMISHATYPLATKTSAPASLSKAWIREVLRQRIGFRNMIVSDDLEMGAISTGDASVGEAAVEHIRAGGNLCLVCHRADMVEQAQGKLLQAAEEEPRFAALAADSVRRTLAFKKKFATILRGNKVPAKAAVEKLSRRLWEFGEQVRLQSLAQQSSTRRVRA